MTSKNYADIIREYERLKMLNWQLLEACKALLSLLDLERHAFRPEIEKARAAIKKAEAL